MATKNAGQTTTTLDDIMGAVRGVGQKVDHLTTRVDALDERVTSLEAAPTLKTRMVQPAGNGRSGPAPMPAPQVVYAPQKAEDEGEDEAIKSGTWAKVIKTSRCYRVGITKTRVRDAWKLKLYLRGQRRPATIIGWDGTQFLIDFMREVWPEISPDMFDEATFAERDEGQSIPPEFQYEGMLFLADWFRSSPNYRGHTFINVEGVFPIDD